MKFKKLEKKLQNYRKRKKKKQLRNRDNTRSECSS